MDRYFRNRVYDLMRQGLNERQIALVLRRPQSVVRRCLKEIRVDSHATYHRLLRDFIDAHTYDKGPNWWLFGPRTGETDGPSREEAVR